MEKMYGISGTVRSRRYWHHSFFLVLLFELPSSPVFITESQTDAVVLTAHDWVPANNLSLPTVTQYIQEWHANMSIAQQQVIASPHKNGVFSPACFIHTGFNYTLPLIQGYSYMQVCGR
jgi:hypothetical protein